jgi:hypothetical protein
MLYCIELLSLLNLEINKDYLRKFIFDKIKKKRSYYNCKLWRINKKFLNLIMDYNLVNTNDSFYKLFYLKGIKWRKHYKIGFTNSMIYQMIDSLQCNKNRIEFNYYDTGEHINTLII